jgi:hypothetical protein
MEGLNENMLKALQRSSEDEFKKSILTSCIIRKLTNAFLLEALVWRLLRRIMRNLELDVIGLQE